MKNGLLLLLFLLLFGMAGSVNATVLDFEDITSAELNGPPFDSYHSIINWEDNTWLQWADVQDPYTPSSGVHRLTAYYEDTTPSWEFLQDVTYQGSYFSGYPQATVQYELFLNGSSVYISEIFAPSSTPTFFATNYSGLVDSVTIHTPYPWSQFWAMDDLTYNEQSNPPVPEPATMMLFGIGLLGLAGVNRRKQ